MSVWRSWEEAGDSTALPAPAQSYLIENHLSQLQTSYVGLLRLGWLFRAY